MKYAWIAPSTYIIYSATNLVNGKIYVGKTRHTLAKRRAQHLSAARKVGAKLYLHKAINAHNADNFQFAVIDTAESFDESNIKEIHHIKRLNSQDSRHGYNMTAGGEGVDSETSRKETLRRIAAGTHSCIGEAGRALQQRCMEAGTNIMGKVMECPHCGKVGRGTVMFRYHMSACLSNVSVTAEQIAKRKSEGEVSAGLRSKLWEVESPNGDKTTVKNLRKFCLEHGLWQSAMSAVAAGRQRAHKGFVCKAIEGACYA